MSKRKLMDVLLAVVTAIIVVADKVHDKDKEIEQRLKDEGLPCMGGPFLILKVTIIFI